jgi:hypothetical protein
LVIVALVLASSAGSPATARAASRHLCRVRDLTIVLGRVVSEATEQDSQMFRLRNRGADCLLDGYPVVSFLGAHGQLPFRVSHRGDQMVTDQRPRAFVVRHGGSAWFLINQTSCNAQAATRPFARDLILAFPGDHSRPLRFNLVAHPSARIPELCVKSESWANRVAVSPFEPNEHAAFARHY